VGERRLESWIVEERENRRELFKKKKNYYKLVHWCTILATMYIDLDLTDPSN